MQPRPWTQPNAPTLAAPDGFMYLRLRIEDAWLTEEGAWVDIREAETVCLLSILGYLRWHAPLLMTGDPDGAGFAGPDAYLASRPLVAAIDAELTQRDQITAGSALAYLRAIGPAPWELATSRLKRKGTAR